MSFAFAVQTRCPRTAARSGRFETPHGPVLTPAFMPVGTRATVKGVTPERLRAVGSQMVLANTYHLALRPGSEVIRELGGLHRFMGWDGPILTDSGGYQIFSLRHLTQVDDDGATLRSIVDGSPVRFTPERTMAIERDLGADVVMALDHCPADPTARSGVAEATERTHRWLERCVRNWHEAGALESGQALFGIVQGGIFPDLRARSVEAVTAHDLPGYAVGGLSVGERRAQMLAALDVTVPLLPDEKPRYLMGVGTPRDFFEAIRRGVDLFDCVTPTRHGRNHQVYTSRGRINVRNRVWRLDDSPLDPHCDCQTCTKFSRGYLRHLATTGEMLAGILLSEHNLRFFHRLMEDMRRAIGAGTLPEFEQHVQRASDPVDPSAPGDPVDLDERPE